MDDQSTTDQISTDPSADTPAVAKRTRRRAASRPAGPPAEPAALVDAPAEEKPKKAARKRAAKKAAPVDTPTADELPDPGPSGRSARSTRPDPGPSGRSARSTPPDPGPSGRSARSTPPDEENSKKATRKRATKKSADAQKVDAAVDAVESAGVESDRGEGEASARMAAPAFVAPLFQAPDAVEGEPEAAAPRRGRRKKAVAEEAPEQQEPSVEESDESPSSDASEGAEDADESESESEDGGRRRRRRRGGRRRRRGGEDASSGEGDSEDAEAGEAEGADGSEGPDDEGGASRRRRRRRRRGSSDDADGSPDDPPNTVTRVREPRSKGSDDVTSLKGSTRLEAKKQRRREGREAGRRRAPILTEAEFLARRESVNRVMAVRQEGDRTQIAVLEDGVLVEHYVTRGSSGSMVGNVYLGRVQNVLPSMEAAFVDIGRGRNAVLYAGEVNWDAAGLEGQPKRIEFALKSGDPVLVQVTKDPVGQKGARLTSQISLPGRFLVYVPDGSMTGISRKLPDTERSRLKRILKRVMPDDAGVIVRTAAEGAPEEALEADVERLKAQWADISSAATSANPPSLLYSEPDLAIKVVRDIFNEDVNSLVVSGDTAWSSLSAYIGAVAPDLVDRLQHWSGSGDVFAEYRVDEQLMKALDRKVYLPSGGSLVIDRTEAMTVVDVNTGKFTGQGGNLEQTVTRNNLEAAEEIVRQLRLRDIGGIIVVDFIDMVLESNRDLVLRRLVECLGRDRTKHQVAEVTSLGLVQMTRKRIGSGLLESFSTTCEHCNGRGIRVSLHADHQHESPKSRKPAGFVDPAEAAAKALAANEEPEQAEEVVAEAVDPAGTVDAAEAVEAVEAVEVVGEPEEGSV